VCPSRARRTRRCGVRDREAPHQTASARVYADARAHTAVVYQRLTQVFTMPKSYVFDGNLCDDFG
jgi:hypothetical protein